MTKKESPQKQLADARRRLLERSGQLRADIGRELRKYDDEHYTALADRVADTGEQSVADLLVDLDLAEITRDVVEFRDIEAALLRIAHGSYGVCVDCGTQIDAQRLRQVPSAARCVPCQQRYERQHPEEKHPAM
jgi:RNA polymerase-binding transcription factor DksA